MSSKDHCTRDPRTNVPESDAEDPYFFTDFLSEIRSVFSSQSPLQCVRLFLNSVTVAETVLNKFSQGLIERDQAGHPDSSLLLRTR